MEKFVVGDSEIEVTDGLPEAILPERESRHQAVVLTHPGAGAYADRVAKVLRATGLGVDVVGLPDRDEAKTLEVASTLYDRFARIGLSREDTVVGVGGGSVTDLAGFVAGTWMRGIEVVHIPTTLLAAVDAAIGGKTGINLRGKNSVGVFWSPTRVLVDLEILRHLPAMLVLEGMAEILKCGFIGDMGLTETIEAEGVEAPLERLVPGAIRVKARYVAEDPRDESVRAMLNFGHTIGHAVEYASALSHGLSVGVGMVAAAAVSEKEVGFSDRDRLVDAIRGLGLGTDVGSLDRSRVTDLLGLDKKRDREGLRMVLLEEFEEPVIRYVDSSSVDVALDSIGL